MKKLILGISLLLFSVFAQAQGLQNIIVEKYYISNAADAAGSAGTLPVGSVTYRIYADLLPGYKFQAAYGIATHTLLVQTSTTFFNNEDRGATSPTYTKAQAALNTVMLDSWLSVGAGCVGNFGIEKTDDNGVANVVNSNGILQSANPIAGIPLTTQDGLIAGSPEPVTTVGLTAADLSVLDATSQAGSILTTNNGSWASLNGSTGPNASNKVLIGQFTTDGTFHFELNIQIGTPSSGVENYVASNPTGLEISIPSLTGTFAPDILPTVAITTPSNGANFITGDIVTIGATANDADGTVSSVEFFVNNVSIGVGTLSSGTYTTTWTSTTGTKQITAVATDNDFGQSTSSIVTINVAPAHAPYGVVSGSNTCYNQTFCLPVTAQDAVANIIGYDMTLHYDNTKVTPTGVITVSNALISPSYVSVAHTTNAALGLINISLFFNASAPPSTNFNGIGDLFCVEFAKTGGFGNADSAAFTVDSIQESYVTNVAKKAVDPGKYKTYRDSTFNATLTFWYDNSPIRYDIVHPGDYLITNIYGNNVGCSSRSATAVQPNLAGSFVYNMSNGLNVDIEKNIAGTTDVQPVINGFDALLTRKVLLNDLTFIPTIYQAIAMDVNTDGVISAGDLSQINQRTVLLIPEFKQTWNYNTAGNHIPGTGPSKDWLFVAVSTVGTDPHYVVSSTYPSDDGTGFSKSRVPVVPFCLSIPIAGAASCQLSTPETYKGILLGDVNGNYATAIPNNQFRQDGSNKVVFDLSKAVIENGYIDIPVSVVSDDVVNALDFAMQFNGGNLTFHSVIDHATYLQSLANFNASDNTFRFTSSSMQNYDIHKSLVSVRFALNGEEIFETDLNSLQGYLNGERVGVEIRNANAASNADVSLYPNPATGILNVEVSENATIQLLDVDGRQVVIQTNVNANQKHEINTQSIANGIYMMKIYNDSFVSLKKVVINN